MMDDNRFDDFIGRAARDLDPAPDAPREEMWAAIASARQDEKLLQAAAVVPITSARSHPARINNVTRWGAALAAMLVLGIGLGRITTRGPVAVQTPTPATTASTDSNATADPQNTGDSRTLATLDREPITSVTPPVDRSPGLTRVVKRGRGQNASASSEIVRGSGAANTGNSAASSALPYRMVAVKHFNRVHALLVAMPTDVAEGNINEVAVRAADLLVNTRLLLDSPIASEPELNRLLDDLELILAQVATISPTRSAEDVQSIQSAINKRDVLLRLHAVTAGSRLSGT